MTDKSPIIRVGAKLGEAFEQLQDKIRERAYHLSLNRDSDRGDSMTDWLHAQSEVLTPVELEVKEQKKNIVVEANLKGFSPAEIEIEVEVEVEVEVEGDVLRVFGSHSESSSEEKDGATESVSESVYFFQSVHLPAAVDLDESHAKLFKNGKLKVTLPKKPQAKT
jgi:HSP20 family molecular chaperone IbpA